MSELEGLRKANARLQRSRAKQGEHLLGLVNKNAHLRYELGRLEDLLAWICGTEQPLPEIRRVVAAAIPQRLKRGEGRAELLDPAGVADELEASLGQVGEDDWTPRDALAARAVRALRAVAER